MARFKWSTAAVRQAVNEKFNGRIDASEAEWVNDRTKMKFRCCNPDHGEFETHLSTLLNSDHGCQKCNRAAAGARNRAAAGKRLLDDVVERLPDIDFSGSVYVDDKTPIEAFCPKEGHGVFSIRPGDLKNTKYGCKHCGFEARNALAKRDSEANFMALFDEPERQCIDTSKVVWKGNGEPVELICNHEGHGTFWITPAAYKGLKYPCPRCGEEARDQSNFEQTVTHEEYSHKLSGVYGDSILCVKFSGVGHKATFMCKEHGEFEGYPYDMLGGRGCFECNRVARDLETLARQQARFEARRAEKGMWQWFDYSGSIFRGMHVEMEIKCLECDEFFTMTPHAHLNSVTGCPTCSFKLRAQRDSQAANEALFEQAKVTHVDKGYVYPRGAETDSDGRILAVCSNPKHGEFYQRLYDHANGSGCPRCATKISKGEQEVAEYVRSLGFEVHQSRRDLLGDRRELDIFVPERNLAIEYCGLRFHSDQLDKDKRLAVDRHISKTDRCDEVGISLITLYEDEWLKNQDKVKEAIAARLGVKPKGVAARKCKVVRVSNETSREFLNKWHLQGAYNPMKENWALYDDNEGIVALMSFSVPTRGNAKAYKWELRRFVSNGETHAGAASRLFKAFIKNHPEVDVIASFSDRRWFDGGMYAALGFELEGITNPSYEYVCHKTLTRHHASSFTRAGIKSKFPEYYAEDLTEKQMMENSPFSRIWDCGKKRWMWRR